MSYRISSFLAQEFVIFQNYRVPWEGPYKLSSISGDSHEREGVVKEVMR